MALAMFGVHLVNCQVVSSEVYVRQKNGGSNTVLGIVPNDSIAAYESCLESVSGNKTVVDELVCRLRYEDLVEDECCESAKIGEKFTVYYYAGNYNDKIFFHEKPAGCGDMESRVGGTVLMWIGVIITTLCALKFIAAVHTEMVAGDGKPFLTAVKSYFIDPNTRCCCCKVVWADKETDSAKVTAFEEKLREMKSTIDKQSKLIINLHENRGKTPAIRPPARAPTTTSVVAKTPPVGAGALMLGVDEHTTIPRTTPRGRSAGPSDRAQHSAVARRRVESEAPSGRGRVRGRGSGGRHDGDEGRDRDEGRVEGDGRGRGRGRGRGGGEGRGTDGQSHHSTTRTLPSHSVPDPDVDM